MAKEEIPTTQRRKLIWSSAYTRNGTLADPAQARTALTEAISILAKLDQGHKLTAAQKSWPDMLRTVLSKPP